MKIELFDSYNIRVRISVSIILLSPIILSLFLCFENVFNTLSSAVIILILLAFANYLPMIQRALSAKTECTTNYAAQYLHPTDSTFDPTTKERYYKKLSSLDPSFSCLAEPATDSREQCVASAVSFLREKTRDCRLVLEENINYGFCKNLQSAKPWGIAICIVIIIALFSYAMIKHTIILDIPLRIWFTIAVNIIILLFWIIGVRRGIRDAAAKRYAKALIMAIDSL